MRSIQARNHRQRRFHGLFKGGACTNEDSRAPKALVCRLLDRRACRLLRPRRRRRWSSRQRFTPLGVCAPYLMGDIIGGQRARAAKMRAAKIRPLGPAAGRYYMADLDSELRRQTAGIGLDVLQVGGSIVVRIPARLTFDPGSAAVKPQIDATLLEIARTVKTRNQTFVDVLAHTDTSGTPQINQALSDSGPPRSPTYLAAHGVSKARIASKGLARPRRSTIPTERNAEGGQPPDRDPPRALPRLAPLGEEAARAARRIRLHRFRRVRPAGDGMSAGRRSAAP